MPYIIFVRHGESEANVDSELKKPKYISDSLDAKLTKLGQIQAKETAKLLKEQFNIKKIYASPLLRCQQTSKIIAEKIKVPIITDNILREISGGDLDGMLVSELNKKPYVDKVNKIFDEFKKYDNMLFLSNKDIDKYDKNLKELNKIVNYETYNDAIIRSKKIIKKYILNETHNDILICAHNGLIKAILEVYTNIEIFKMPDNFGKYKNCHITVFDADKKNIKLMLYSKHLDNI